MSLLDTASLIVTPNGYKEGKLYSVIPSDGSGDMSVTRATTATRVNSAGLVELVPYNLFQYSEQIDNGYWSKYQSTITANNTTAPNGTLTADRLTQNGASAGTFYVFPSAFSGGLVSLSCFYKKGIGNIGWLEINRGAESCYIQFNLDTQVISASGNYLSTNIENVGNGWYRCSVVSNQSAGTANYVGFGNIGNNGDTIFAWGAQLNEGSLKPYQKTETRLNIPRLDYSNGTCPSLLVEPQRTNISQYVESGDGNFNEATVTNATSIVGLKTFKVETNVPLFGDAPSVESNTQYQANTPYTLSFYTDFNQCNDTSIACSFLAFFPVLGYTGIRINKATKAITTFNVGGVWTLNSYEAEQIDGEIYRIKVTATPSLTAVSFSRNYINAETSGTFAAFAGIQLESGSYPTSFINKPTSASVTRNADVISKTGISSLIGQTEGTLFWEGQGNTQSTGDDLWIFGASVNDTSTAVLLYYVHSSGYINCYINNGSSYVNLGVPMTITNNNKVAVGYKSGDFVMYVNGAQVDSNTSATAIPSTMNQVAFNKWQGATGLQKQSMKAAALWKTRLTNTQLAQLTTI